SDVVPSATICCLSSHSFVYHFCSSLSYLLCFFFHFSVYHRNLHSFPTRRSSDLCVSFYSIATGAFCKRCEWKSLFAPALFSATRDRKSTRLNSSHVAISYAVFCLKKKKLRSIALMTQNTVPLIISDD